MQLSVKQFLFYVSLAIVLFVFLLATYRTYDRSMSFRNLLSASSTGDVGQVEALISSASVDVKMLDGWHTTALMMASLKGHNEVVKVLLANGASVNERSRDQQTPLMHASRNGHVETVKYLLSNGASLDLRDTNGLSALDHALKENRAKTVAFLKGENKTKGAGAKNETDALKTTRIRCQEP